jgi:lipoprotein-anchoring transpeptidase ErfK/SrfK
MHVRLLLLALLATTANVELATARSAVGPAPAPAVDAPGALQLAQYREVEVFYDEYGREILLDPYTGEVLAVREPQRRPRYEEWPQDEPYFEEDVYSRIERRMRELGRAPDQGGWREERRAPGGWRDDYVRPEWDRVPERAPDRRWDERPVESARPDDVERRPLEETAALPEAPVQEDGSVIVVEPETGLVPDVTQPPQLDMSGASEQVASFQILLGRIGASPGVIDGRIGDNVNKAISMYRQLTGETLRTYDRDYIEAELERTGGPAFTTYEITAQDAAGPYVASIPEDYGEKAQMERMGYTSVVEMLAERFHMDERYLRSLNPEANFDRPGTIIRVANVKRPAREKVARIVADKPNKQLRGYDASGKLVVAYPATIGSSATPSPTGTHTVERIALNPEYTYNPKINFQQGNNDRVLTIPPGPNGPVGSVWIALSKPTYGIHGTPEPSKIGRTYSNGCIRLTNWDAEELAKLVSKGVTVEFSE